MTQQQRRDLWTWIHRWLGLSAMAFLVIAAATGCVLCFKKPLDRALNQDLFARTSGGPALDPLVLVTRFGAAHPELQVRSFPLNIAPGDNLPVMVVVAPGAREPGFDQAFLDRADARIVGTRSDGPGWDRRHLVDGIEEFHKNLLGGTVGRWVMGLAALAWLVSNLIGVYLTWPRKAPFLKAWKRMWRFSVKSMFARLMLDVHRSTGLWLLIGVTVLAFTSVCLNFYSEMYEPTVARIAPSHDLFDDAAPYPDGTRPTLSFADAVARATRKAAADGLGWQPATAIYKPDWNLYGVTLTDDGRLQYRGLGPVYYYFDAKDGHLANVVDPYRGDTGLALIRMLYPLHSGQVGGWPTVVLIFLLGLATVEMAITGFYVWWKKRRSRIAAEAAARRNAARAAPLTGLA
ncbi:MAG: PepSY-associated helix protein [Sphingomonas bacterium]|uniref:PepSY-associated TM helix domain-containing protein n=1 Tax=Sphingomonas bacterium TaxID=1895847 RepID=UPI002628609E|nr:PepSY-associated TM helix domain-containing protein [Sphingomonas bacterium]MDB5708791.1 PepSY-associated helix protein [Sphingomonas bacterium]